MRRLAPHPIVWLAFFVFSCNSSDKEASAPRPAPADERVQAGKYSPAFSLSLDTLMASYRDLVSGFGQPEAQGKGSRGEVFLNHLSRLSLDDFKGDTLVYQTVQQQKGNTESEMKSLVGETTLTGQRLELNMVSQDLYDLLRTIRYAGKTLYFMECASAFGEDKPGNWISFSADSSQISNPFGVSGHCAVPRDSLPGHP